MMEARPAAMLTNKRSHEVAPELLDSDPDQQLQRQLLRHVQLRRSDVTSVHAANQLGHGAGVVSVDLHRHFESAPAC